MEDEKEADGRSHSHEGTELTGRWRVKAVGILRRRGGRGACGHGSGGDRLAGEQQQFAWPEELNTRLWWIENGCELKKQTVPDRVL